MSEFFPLNELEVGLVAAQKKAISVEEFIRKIILSDLVLPSAGEVKEDGSGFQPIFFDKVGTKMLAAFTDMARALQLEHIAEYYLAINALEVLRRIPRGYDVVINPSLEVGLELSPEGIANIVKEFC